MFPLKKLQSDNDFLTTHGISLGVPFNGGIDVDNQFLVFRLTLPSIPRGSLQKAIGALWVSLSLVVFQEMSLRDAIGDR